MTQSTVLIPDHPFTVALTGGIASGKTLISDEFARLGVPIIDTDVIAHQIVEPDQPALREIEEAFGAEIIDENGRLKRGYLRSLIFSDSKARNTLESIMHPRIRQEVSKVVSQITRPYCILVIPLLIEKGTYPNIDRVLVVDVSTEKQIHRLMARDHCSREEAQRALATQASREQRLRIANDVLDNSGSTQQARDKVALLNTKYTYLATHRCVARFSDLLGVQLGKDVT